MTWILGASSLFGYGVILSDIQVSVGDKRFDMIQKAYPITNFIIGGFAGSVKIGFMLLQSLSDSLYLPEELQATYAWEPLKIANAWSPIARDIFFSQPMEQQQLGSRFLIVAASPEPDKKMSIPGWDSKIYIIRFSSPDFKPQIMSRRVNFCSIGSGSKVNKFQQHLRKKLKLGIFDKTLHAEVRNPRGWANNLAFSLFRLIDDYPQDGISKNMHLLTVRRGEMTERSMAYRSYLPDGQIVEDAMPKKIARSYDDMVEMLCMEGVNVAHAVC
jgi:hypothetical protein